MLLHAHRNGSYHKDQCWWECKEKGMLVHCWWEHKLVQPLWKMVWRLLKHLKMELMWSSHLTSWDRPRWNKDLKDTPYIPMLSTALFTVAEMSTLQEISPEHSLEGLMLKLKHQFFSHLLEEPTHEKRLWCWERLKAGGEGDDRIWDGWIASLTQWTWVWANSG